MVPYLFGWDGKAECGQGPDSPKEGPVLRPTAANVWQGADVRQLIVASFCTLVVTADGLSEDIGGGEFGQKPDGVRTAEAAAVPVPTLLPPVRQISAVGTHGLALTVDERVFVWGSNHDGELGNGTIGTTEAGAGATAIPLEVDLSPFAAFGKPIAVSAGPDHMVVLYDSGDYVAWGRGERGALGDGTYETKLVPTRGLLSEVKAIVCGWGWTLAIRRDGILWAWGDGAHGEFGFTAAMSPVPVRISPVGMRFASIAAAGGKAIAIREDGVPMWWGEIVPPAPAKPLTRPHGGGLDHMVACSVGCYKDKATCLLLRRDGEVFGQGMNEQGQLGDGTRVDKPGFVPLGVKARTVEAGEMHSGLLA